MSSDEKCYACDEELFHAKGTCCECGTQEIDIDQTDRCAACRDWPCDEHCNPILPVEGSFEGPVNPRRHPIETLKGLLELGARVCALTREEAEQLIQEYTVMKEKLDGRQIL